MSRQISLLLLTLALTVLGLGRQVVSLPDVLNPQDFSVHNNRVYVIEGAEISIYSLDDFRLVKRFGKRGEGPREFKPLPFSKSVKISFPPGKVQVLSLDRLSFFTYDGIFIDEQKMSKVFQFPVFYIYPLKNKYVIQELKTGENRSLWRVINIYSSNLKKEKELLRFLEDRNQAHHLLKKTYSIRTFDDKIFVVASRDFVIDVFDSRGEMNYTIKQNYFNLKLTDKRKEEILEGFKSNPGNRKFYPYVKNRLTFPGSFPAIKDFYVTNGKIYVLTYGRKANKSEFFILDLKGKLLKKVYLTLGSHEAGDGAVLKTIVDDKLYQLLENGEEEKWELYIDAIN